MDGRIPLTWDHMDGDCTNNRRQNLRLLCPKCQALTDTYGSLNVRSRRTRLGNAWWTGQAPQLAIPGRLERPTSSSAGKRSIH